MTKLIDFLRGKKTYLAALIVGVLAAANYLGYIVPDWLLLAVGSAFGLSLRAAVAKSNGLK